MITKEQIAVLETCAKKYKENLVGYNFLVLLHIKSEYSYVELSFEQNNFLHLTGAKWNNEANNNENKGEINSANSFFDRLITNTFYQNTHYEIKGFNKVKLNVLPLAVEFYKHVRYCGNYNFGGIKLICDKVVGNKVFSLCINKEYNKDGRATGYYFPRSLLKQDTNKIVNNNYAVEAIFRKPRLDRCYKSCVYISNSVKEPLFKLPLPKEIKNKISNYLKIEEGQYELANYQASHSKKSSDDGKSK